MHKFVQKIEQKSINSPSNKGDKRTSSFSDYRSPDMGGSVHTAVNFSPDMSSLDPVMHRDLQNVVYMKKAQALDRWTIE
jgi:hypothetical protein